MYEAVSYTHLDVYKRQGILFNNNDKIVKIVEHLMWQEVKFKAYIQKYCK